MNVFGIGTGELLLILLIVLLVMGPERLPQLARQWGKMVRVLNRFTRTWHEISAEITRQMNLEDIAGAPPKPKPVPTPAAPEPDESNNTIAPTNMLRPSAPQPEGDAEGPTLPAPEPDESGTAIAPPDRRQPAAPQPNRDAESLTPPPELAVEALPADGDLAPGPARPTSPAEPTHE